MFSNIIQLGVPEVSTPCCASGDRLLLTLPSLATQPKEAIKTPGEPTTLLISYPSFSTSTCTTPLSPKSSRGCGIMLACAKSEHLSGWPSTRACRWALGSKQWVFKLTAKAATSASQNPPSTASWIVFMLNGLGRPSTASGKNGRRLTASPSLGPSSSLVRPCSSWMTILQTSTVTTWVGTLTSDNP